MDDKKITEQPPERRSTDRRTAPNPAYAGPERRTSDRRDERRPS